MAQPAILQGLRTRKYAECGGACLQSQHSRGSQISASFQVSQGTVRPHDTAIPYAERTRTVLVGRRCGTSKQTLPGRAGMVGLRCKCGFGVQSSLGESSIYQQRHWHHVCCARFSQGLQPPPVRSVLEVGCVTYAWPIRTLPPHSE